jgi:hypothetical protein
VELKDLTEIVTAPGPFVTVHVPSESDVEQAADQYALVWKDVVRDLTDQGVDAKTVAAVEAARGEHFDGASRFVVASTTDGDVKLALSLDQPPRRPVVEVAPLPHLLPVLDSMTTRVPYVVAVVDREGAEIWSSDGESTELDHEGTIEAPTTRGQARRDQRSTQNSWRGTVQDASSTVERMVRAVSAELVLLAGETKILAGVRAEAEKLGPKVVVIPGTRHADGSEPLLREAVEAEVAKQATSDLLTLLEDYAQERGQIKRACDGVVDVVAALRKAQVQTLLLTTAAPEFPLFFGPEPTQLGRTAEEVRELGAEEVLSGPLVDVLIRSALGTGADVQLVPAELDEAPDEGVGAVLRYADDSA